MPKKKTYGFKEKETAEQLKQFVGGGDELFPQEIGRTPTRIFRFTLNESLSDGTADADILWMDGTDTGVDATIYDPLGIFSTLTTNAAGLCLLQGNRYYIIQAPCP